MMEKSSGNFVGFGADLLTIHIRIVNLLMSHIF